ncbi:MAG: Proline--tRNA ligase [Chlamydiae bacterium]|nr:Proline--tRNA ligase [Chlamydiota bacterium]
MSQKLQKNAISPRRDEDFPEWYQQVIKAADMAENSPVRGAMVIKPWGYAIWENLQRDLDREIKRRGHVNAYFPLFIPLSFLEKEASHVEGFAKECAVVTHCRLEEKDGKLIPTSPLEEPLIVRPTSETIIGDCYSRWIESYRDLPVLINQWANVVRWEMRPRIFLRTTEFLWQEGHTAHATRDEAIAETMDILEMYRNMAEEVLAMPVIVGKKSPGERFPGAESTFSIEAMMQDRKALQAGTSHYLGQNFSKTSDISFSNREGELEYAYTTSWGVTTRLIGGVIMTHSDDDGLRLPPRIAPQHVVIVPFVPKPELEAEVFAYAEKLAHALRELTYHGEPIRVLVDKREIRGGEKNWEWIKKGVPVRIEVGPRDMESQSAMVARRDKGHKEKENFPVDQIPVRIVDWLNEIQSHYFDQAKAFRDQHIRRDIASHEELREFFTPKNKDKPEIHGGFVIGKWCGDEETEAMLKELQLTIRCILLEQSGTEGTCLITGRPATLDVIYAKAY